MFYGENRGGGEARTGGFTAKFRGFWAERGCGTSIQSTADMGGLTGRKKFLKIFKKRVKNPKIGVREVLEDGLGAPYIGCAGGAIFRRDF